jgi:hypothetical protein
MTPDRLSTTCSKTRPPATNLLKTL